VRESILSMLLRRVKTICMVWVGAYASGLLSPTLRYLHPVPRYTLGVIPILVNEVAFEMTCRRLDPDHLLLHGCSGMHQLFEDADKAFLGGDYKTAYRRKKPLAELGSAKAQAMLCLMYSNGLGVPQDYVLAYMWLKPATSRYPASEKEGREKAKKGTDHVASKMTLAQLADAQKLAEEWKPKKER
jgi:Sel1 repeat